jgi:hypothetical protein
MTFHYFQVFLSFIRLIAIVGRNLWCHGHSQHNGMCAGGSGPDAL